MGFTGERWGRATRLVRKHMCAFIMLVYITLPSPLL